MLQPRQMFVSVCTVVSSILIPNLEPLDLCKLRRVIKQMAASVTLLKVEAAMEKYKHLVVLSDDTIRIHSISGKTAIELILPRGNGMAAEEKFVLYMRLDGRFYSGWAEPWMRKINGQMDNMARYMFHDKSTWLFGARQVVINECRSIYRKHHRQVEVVVMKNEIDGWTFTLHFYEVLPST